MEKKEEKKDATLVEYKVAGNVVKLSFGIVKNYLTRGNGNVTNADLVQFINVCKFNQLNPFLNEAYLIKFGTNPATMVVSKEAFMKRADACPAYSGIEAGIIVKNEDGTYEDVEGCFYHSNQALVGGWAKVHRKDRDFPIVSRVNLAEYQKETKIWKEKLSTMISKVAKVQALREAFPAQLGAMYTAEEQGVVDASYSDIPITPQEATKEAVDNTGNKGTIGFEDDLPQDEIPVVNAPSEVTNGPAF